MKLFIVVLAYVLASLEFSAFLLGLFSKADDHKIYYNCLKWGSLGASICSLAILCFCPIIYMAFGADVIFKFLKPKAIALKGWLFRTA